MSTALLKFHQVAQEPFDPAILAAAVEASLYVLAVTENGKLIYRNPSFVQLMSSYPAAEQGSALIRQLMTVGREEPGEPSSVCFNRVVRDLYSLLRHLLG